MLVQRTYEDGTTDKVTVKNLESAKKAPKKKKSPIRSIAIIDAVLGVVIAVIHLIKGVKK